jgi:hypothetical protein
LRLRDVGLPGTKTQNDYFYQPQPVNHPLILYKKLIFVRHPDYFNNFDTQCRS